MLITAVVGIILLDALAVTTTTSNVYAPPPSPRPHCGPLVAAYERAIRSGDQEAISCAASNLVAIGCPVPALH
jgi:hypothetical protein